MFVLGHIGIGSRLGSLVLGARAAGVERWLILGTVLPDLVDKPLYYGLSLATGPSGAALDPITCTRTVGHSAIFALLLWLVLAAVGRRAAGLALVVGMATHSVLDLGGDVTGFVSFRLGLASRPQGFSSLKALLFPLVGGHFSNMPFHSIREHLLSLGQAYTIGGELVGGALLLLAWRAARDDQRHVEP
jgi:hypothetical protein